MTHNNKNKNICWNPDITNDFIIIFTLDYTSNNITNNIPVKYCVKLINNI